jgi:hypothetical protein
MASPPTILRFTVILFTEFQDLGRVTAKNPSRSSRLQCHYWHRHYTHHCYLPNFSQWGYGYPEDPRSLTCASLGLCIVFPTTIIKLKPASTNNAKSRHQAPSCLKINRLSVPSICPPNAYDALADAPFHSKYYTIALDCCSEGVLMRSTRRVPPESFPQQSQEDTSYFNTQNDSTHMPCSLTHHATGATS